MPVKKYRSVEEMPGPSALPPLDPENLESALSLTEVACRMSPWRFEPGIHKFRSVDEANRSRAAWETRLIREKQGTRR